MWHPINYGTAENDEGIRISRSGFKEVTYSQNGREVVIDAESGPEDLAIFARSITRWSDGAVITRDEQQQMVANIKDAFQCLRVPIEIVWI